MANIDYRCIAIEYTIVLNMTIEEIYICLDFELTNHTPYTAFWGELWGVFCELFADRKV